MKHLVPKTAVTVITAAAALLAIPAMASAAPLHVAAKHASTVSVSASPRVADAGTTVKLSATVKSANPTPGGTVTFWHGKTKLCSAKLANKSGHCNTKFDAAGSYAVSGVYSGDAKHSGSTGKVTVVAEKAATTTTVSVSVTAPMTGQSVTLNADVSSKSPLAATGHVRFTSGSTTLSTVTVSKGAAHYTYAWKTPGKYTVTATYLGDGAHSPSARTSGTITVTAPAPTATTTKITGFNPTPVDPGTTSMVTVTVTSAVGTPTGQVTVVATGADAKISGDSCTKPITLVDGTGSCPISPAAGTFGDIPLLATYSGDATHKGSTATYTLQVPAPTMTTVAFDATTDVLTATVDNETFNNISPTAGGTGTVTFTTGAAGAAGTPIAGCTDVALIFTATSGTGATAKGTNNATCDYTPTAGTTVTVYATYSGDASNETSMGSVSITTPGGGD
jgi:large repetitive protein